MKIASMPFDIQSVVIFKVCCLSLSLQVPQWSEMIVILMFMIFPKHPIFSVEFLISTNICDVLDKTGQFD